MLNRETNRIKLSDHFTYGRLLRFCLPSIVMIIFTSIYGVVDGFFISNYAGKTALAAVNLIMPYIMVIGTIGFMFGAGGSALVSMMLGASKKKKANEYFSMIVEVTLILGVISSILSIIFIKQILRALGATEEMMPYAINYGIIGMMSNTGYALQNVFQSFFVAAEKPKYGLFYTIAAGLTNIVLDYVFLGIFSFGVTGASFATFISECVGGYLPIIYFARKSNNSLLYLHFVRIELVPIFKAMLNGLSELLSDVSTSLVSMVYNAQLLYFIGSDGVAAYGVMMYVAFIFTAIFMGYSVGTAPLIAYNYGAKTNNELKNILKKSLYMMLLSGILMSILGYIFSTPLSYLFVGYDEKLRELTDYAGKIFALQFLFAGFNIFASAFFTALNNGLISGLISALRVIVFKLSFVLILPIILGSNGIWYANPLSEICSLIVGIIFMIKEKKNYGY